jgi:hypothetical protein
MRIAELHAAGELPSQREMDERKGAVALYGKDDEADARGPATALVVLFMVLSPDGEA